MPIPVRSLPAGLRIGLLSWLASGERSPRGFRRGTLAERLLSWVCKHPLELRSRLDEFNARQVRSRRLRNLLAGDRSAQHFPQQRFQSRVVTGFEIFLPLWRLRNLQPLVTPATTSRCHPPGPPPAHTFAMAAARAGLFFSFCSLIKNLPHIRNFLGAFLSSGCALTGVPSITPDTSCEPVRHVSLEKKTHSFQLCKNDKCPTI